MKSKKTQINKAKAREKRKRKKAANNMKTIYRPPVSEIKPPEGFRVISSSQSVLEYAKPIFERSDNDITSHQIAINLGMILWNYETDVSKGNEDISFKKKILKDLGIALQLTENKAVDFFDMMIKRKDYLFPPEIQPDTPMTMYMRKEEKNLLSDFNYRELNLSNKIIPPDKKDRNLVLQILELEKMISDRKDYSEWESIYFSFVNNCKERFQKWLSVKGVEKYQEDFPFYVEMFLNFL